MPMCFPQIHPQFQGSQDMQMQSQVQNQILSLLQQQLSQVSGPQAQVPTQCYHMNVDQQQQREQQVFQDMGMLTPYQTQQQQMIQGQDQYRAQHSTSGWPLSLQSVAARHPAGGQPHQVGHGPPVWYHAGLLPQSATMGLSLIHI